MSMIVRHTAWALNPQLNSESFLRLVEGDLRAQERLMDKMCETALEVRDKHGRQAALDYVAMCLPLVLCS